MQQQIWIDCVGMSTCNIINSTVDGFVNDHDPDGCGCAGSGNVSTPPNFTAPEDYDFTTTPLDLTPGAGLGTGSAGVTAP